MSKGFSARRSRVATGPPRPLPGGRTRGDVTAAALVLGGGAVVGFGRVRYGEVRDTGVPYLFPNTSPGTTRPTPHSSRNVPKSSWNHDLPVGAARYDDLH